MSKLTSVIEEAVETGRAAVEVWGPSAQTTMAIEEMAELTLELAREARGRSAREKVIDEAADVIIMALQIGEMYGGELELAKTIERKVRRLSERLDAAFALDANAKQHRSKP